MRSYLGFVSAPPEGSGSKNDFSRFEADGDAFSSNQRSAARYGFGARRTAEFRSHARELVGIGAGDELERAPVSG
jgi:hypothetical protein